MLSEEEKRDIKSKINISINDYRKKKKRQRVSYFFGSAAAIVLVLLSINYIKEFQNTSGIEDYVKTTNVDIEKDGDVKLLLGDNQEITITEKSSSITYSSSGNTININDSKQVEQSAEDKYNTIVVPYGKRTEIVLSEGTKVWLNSGSRLTYPVAFNKDKREVHLVGEAIFDVSHDKNHPFYVITNDYDVKVLGTVFNVSSYEDDSYTSTALESGSVEINYSGKTIFGKSTLKITPGTLAVYNSKYKRIKTKKVDIDKYMSWREGTFLFKKERLDVILKKLSRYYNVKIIVENEKFNEQSFSGYLDITDNIEKVISIIKETTDLEYRIENETILIN